MGSAKELKRISESNDFINKWKGMAAPPKKILNTKIKWQPILKLYDLKIAWIRNNGPISNKQKKTRCIHYLFGG